MPVTAMDDAQKPANNSPLLVTDPNDDSIVVLANRLDAPDFGCALHVSGDGGRSWASTNPVTRLPTGADKCYAPEVAFDAKGALHLLFIGLHGSGNEPMGAFLTTSTDKGQTFTSPHRVLGPRNFGVRLAVDRSIGSRGRIHLVWLHARSDPPLGGFSAGPNPILASWSDDGGATFSQPVQVSDSGRARVVAPVLALGPRHAVHVGYYDLKGDARDYEGLEGPVWEESWSIVVATSSDGGRRFGHGTVVDSAIAPPERPMLIFTMAPPALVADGNQVCAAWTDARHGDADVLGRCSADRAQHWGPVRRINDDRVGNGTRQYLPRLSLAPGGRIDAVYLDRRRDPHNVKNDVSYTFSVDGGRRFAPNRRLTGVPSSPEIGQQYAGPAAEGQVEIGARLGLVSRLDRVVAAWPDTRNSRSGTAQEIVSTAIDLPLKPGHPAWASALGAALVAAGGAVAAAVAVRTSRRLRSGTTVAAERQPTHSASPEPRPRARRRLVTVAILASTAVGVGWAGADPGHPRVGLRTTSQVVDVAMSEYRFAYRPPTSTGRAVFRVRNAGRENHIFGLYVLPDDIPPLDVQLHSDTRHEVRPVVELPRLEPGKTQFFAVDLVPGRRYGLLCFLTTAPGGKVHALEGMNAEFLSGGPRPRQRIPTSTSPRRSPNAPAEPHPA